MNAVIVKPQTYFTICVFKPLLIISVLLVLGACSNKVTVVGNIPSPLVQRVSLNVHLSYTEKFKNYVYVENEKKRALTSLNFAQAQINMFEVIFAGLTTLVDANDALKDITIEPEVLEFEYSAPSETSLKQYEVWIKYRLKLLKKDDSKLADWTIKGYGKTPTSLLTSAPQAFNSATNIALRDVGAQLATQFSGQRKIKAIIDKKIGVRPNYTLIQEADTGSGKSTELEINDTAQIINEKGNDE